jgi:hypothetical protein
MNLSDPRHRSRVPLRERFAHPWVRFVALTLYYLGILAGLIALYGQGDFSTPPFVYQNF